jgi:hypothetical protein
MKKYCSIPECENELNPRATSGICSLCRANIAGWAKKPPGQFVQRCRNLRRYTNRMTEVQTKGDSNANRGIRKKTSKANSKTAAEFKHKIRLDLAQTSNVRNGGEKVH